MENQNREQIFRWLDEVKDPEIPVLSIVDLGVITDIVAEGPSIAVTMTPTFVGCPAIDMMKQEVETVLKKRGFKQVTVSISFSNPWTSDRITERGKAALKQFGLAPPPSGKNLVTDIDVLEHAACPRCNGTHTELRNPFGPTLCRSIHYCLDCREAFEQFKPV